MCLHKVTEPQKETFNSYSSLLFPMTGNVPPQWVIAAETHRDERGELTVITNAIPESFQIERVYLVKGTKVNKSRGGHAHRQVSQIIFLSSGKMTVKLESASTSGEYTLYDTSRGIYLPPLVWSEIIPLEDDTSYVVLADGPYDRNEYISEKQEFRNLVERSQ